MNFTSSKYVQLNSYALLEYQYNNSVFPLSDVNFTKVTNYYNGTISYLNTNSKDWTAPKIATGNIIDRTAAQISDSNHILLDKEKLFYYSRKYPGIILEKYENNFNVDSKIVYDNVRIHLQSGWNFVNLAGFFLKLGFVDKYGQSIFFANTAFLKEDEYINYSYKPIQLGEKFYDRYVEVKVPSLYDLKHDNIGIARQLSILDIKFIPKLFDWDSARISIAYVEAKELLTSDDGILYIKLPVKISQDDKSVIFVDLDEIDQHYRIGANIQESSSGDYFEIFPTYNGGFLDSFIAQEALKGNTYVLNHEIEVYEQSFIDGAYNEVLTQRLNQVQIDAFDVPFVFRPVIQNKNTLTFSIDYTLRLFNEKDSSQIIRKSSLTYHNAAKYGKYLSRINIDANLEPIKVVNKILYNTKVDKYYSNNTSVSYTSTNNSNSGNGKNVLTNFHNILVNSNTKIIDTIDVSKITTNNQTYDLSTYNFETINKSDVKYGQNELTLYLNQFDNFVTFSLYKKVVNSTNNTSSILPYELEPNNVVNYYISFMLDDDSIIKIKNLVNSVTTNYQLESNELLFMIDTNTSNKLLKNKINNFTINKEYVNLSEDNTYIEHNVVMYKGYYDSMNNYVDVDYQSKVELLQKFYNKVIEQKTALNSLLSSNKNLLTSYSSLQASAEQAAQLQALITAINQINA